MIEGARRAKEKEKTWATYAFAEVGQHNLELVVDTDDLRQDEQSAHSDVDHNNHCADSLSVGAARYETDTDEQKHHTQRLHRLWHQRSAITVTRMSNEATTTTNDTLH